MKEKMSLSNAKVFMEYEKYAKEAAAYHESTLTQCRGAIRRFFDILDHKDIRKVNRDDLLKYKETIRNQGKENKINLNSALKEIERMSSLLNWLINEKGPKRLSKNDIKFLSLTKEERAHFASSPLVKFPSQEEIEKMLNVAPRGNEIEWRNRIGFIILNSIPTRITALQALRIGCFDMENNILYQLPKKGDPTKHSQTFASYIFERNPGAREEIKEWIDFLYSKGFTDKSPILPRAKAARSKNNLSFCKSTEVTDARMTAKGIFNSVLKTLAENAGVEYYPSHAYRHSLASYALERCVTFDDLKMVIKCFGHKTILTILVNYAQIHFDKFVEIGERINERMKDKGFKGSFIK